MTKATPPEDKANPLEDKVNDALYRSLNLLQGRVICPASMKVSKIEEAGVWQVVTVEAEDGDVFTLTSLTTFHTYLRAELDDKGVELDSAKVIPVKKGLGLSLVVR